MNDGTIYNSAFNIICTVTALSILAAMIMNIIGITTGNPDSVILIIFYNLYRLAMVFMCTFFAYDSAKHQLKKANLSK
jgi:predicted Co/Zn/Cd cation transporter (cation efflux family)